MVHVDNGVVYTNFDTDEWVNSSSEALTGDLVLPNDGTITSIGDAYYDEDWNLYGRYGFIKCENLTGIYIPQSVKIISADAFSECYGLTNIIIPNGVTEIREGALGGCINLTSLIIPNSVTSIERTAFISCKSLTSITIPDGVTSIKESTFEECENLTSLIIPNSVTSIEYFAFGGCTSLASINYNGIKSQWKAILFDDDWNRNTGDYIITCTDGTIAKDGTES